MNVPRISILMPVFNGAQFARSTLDSVLEQSFKDWEIIAMDGGSTDGTQEIFREYAQKHPNIRYYSEPDEGAWHAIYKAARVAEGELFAFMCVSDGYVNKDWLKLCVQKLDEDKEVSLVWGVPYQMSEKGKLLGPNYLYAQFLQEQVSYRGSFLKEVLKKFDPRSPRRLLRVFKKFRPENLVAARKILKGGNVPQKEDWFFHWLETGQFFPDLNMCLYAQVFFDCVPPYVLGHKVVDEYPTLFYNFNAKGYLAWCLPVSANYARAHAGQITDRVVKEAQAQKDKYFANIRELRTVLSKTGTISFIDSNKKPISSRKV